jgi:hypothetical protein
VEKQTRLVIDHQRKCASGVRLEVEVVVTSLDAVAVSNGGTLQSVGRFAQQSELAVAVISGGMIDIRSMTVQNVTAAVISGGRIFTKPQNSLVASVSDGGAITYWGGPSITKSVTHGGVVTQGHPADADKPLSESNHANPAVPAVPPVRAVSSVPQ